MKILTSIAFSTLLSLKILAQVSGVGINTEDPQAALEIKSFNDDKNKVLRFSTEPNNISDNDDNFEFFVGESVLEQGQITALDLRKISLPKLVDKMALYIPSLNKVTLTNKLAEDIASGQNHPVTLNEVLINTNNEMFELTDNKSLKFLKGGTFQITSFVGFKQLKSYEGDILIIIAKKGASENVFSDYKATIVSRSANGSDYSNGDGVGSSFSFVNEFKANDEIRLEVREYTGTNTPLKLVKYGTTMSATLVSPEEPSVQ